MNILVTGGLGYIGSQVSRDLIKKGNKIIIIDNLQNSYLKNKPKKTIFFKSDFANEKVLKIIHDKYKINTVYHFAASISVEESIKKPNEYMNNNYVKSKKLINFCVNNNIKYFIFSSTAAVYKNGPNKKNEKSKIKPSSPYGKSKYLTEKYISKINGVTKFCILRYFNVAGASPNLTNGQNSRKKATHLIKKISDSIINSKKFYINGNNYNTKDGTAIRDFIHIEDLSNIHVKILDYLKKKVRSPVIIFNCGYGKGFSVLDIVRYAQKITHFKYSFKNRRPGDIPSVIACNIKLKKKLNWKPKYNSLNKIIISAVKWEKKLRKN